jgi:hypothetical protein
MRLRIQFDAPLHSVGARHAVPSHPPAQAYLSKRKVALARCPFFASAHPVIPTGASRLDRSTAKRWREAQSRDLSVSSFSTTTTIVDENGFSAVGARLKSRPNNRPQYAAICDRRKKNSFLIFDVPNVNHQLVKAIESGIPSTHFLVCSVGTLAEKIAGCLGLPRRS